MEFLRNLPTMCLSSLNPLFGAKMKGLPRGIAVRWALVLLALASGVGQVQTQRSEHVCGSIDIRNRVDSFRRLENCTVIEGHLRIQLIDYAEPTDYLDLSFPKLVEITQYLLLYRVYGLKTLSHIFPNLAVIRGHKLFYNYALVVFEMPNFEELGLPNLQVISRGAVRIEKNPTLCYIDTIDWTRITKVNKEDNFMLQNKDIEECVNVCPKEGTTHQQRHICPTMEFELHGAMVTQHLCWNSQSCQKVCKSSCGDQGCYLATSPQGKYEQKCCHKECLGGCSGPEPTQCLSCKHVFYKGRCAEECPPYTYMFLQRRCLLEDECKNVKVGSMDIQGSDWKMYDSQCVPECPSGYTENGQDTHKCKKCEGPCPKVCSGMVVDNVAAAQKLKGCTRINGILEIQIRGGSHVGSELEENLGSIEEVKYYVKIVRSYAIISLRFLKNLKIIEGERLFNDRYALFVLDNQNLQDIWDFDNHPNLTIAKGRAFFHFNRKLCFNKIEQLIDSIPGLRNQTDDKDVDPATNGDQVACDIRKLKLEVFVKKANHAIIRWNNFHMSDNRQLLSWVVNYKEAPEKNITIFNARDACGTDDWVTADVRPDTDENAEHVASIMIHLKPFTQYAVYVQSYTISTADRGAMSPIVYFTTEPDVPTPAREIQAVSKVPGELHITWMEPTHPHGKVTHYYVYWQLQALNKKKFDMRDYCVDKPRLHGLKKTNVIEDKKNVTTGGQCPCPKSKEEERYEEQERMFQIEFENFLHNEVYIKRPTNIKRKGRSVEPYYNGPVPEGSRKRRSNRVEGVMGANPYNVLNNITYINLTANYNHTIPDNPDEHEEYEAAIVFNKTEIILTNLMHFQEYSIEVIACHDYDVGLDTKRCSNRAITTARTQADETADNLDERNITIRNESETSTKVIVRWSDPPIPNGLIITYDIELNQPDSAHSKLRAYCLTHQQYREYMENGGYKTEPLLPGNWEFRVRASSLAGNGSWTQKIQFFVVEQIESTEVNITMIIIVTTLVSLLVIAVASVSIFAIVKKKLNPNIPPINYISVNPEYWSTGPVYTPDKWEVERDKISLLRELGQGSFGMVYEGQAMDLTEKMMGESKVAVKTVNEKASMRDRMEFLNEASVMKAFSCNHVVRLLGVVSSQPTWVIMELMAHGDLKNYLRLHRPDEEDNDGRKPPSLKEILLMSGEISDGMAYLASKKYVHCDLAARNCMVAENKVVKIGDFGMTRDIYETDYYRKGGKGLLPVRWMAPESLKDGVFTSQSDVWSFGVVLWEMATLAAQPYQGLANEQVLKYVIDGGKMDKPEGCPDKLYEELMLKCWQYNPKHRPTFCEIIEILVPDLSTSFKDVSWFFSEEQTATGEPGGGGGVAEVEEEEADGTHHPEDCDVHTPLTGSPLHSLHALTAAGESGAESVDVDNADADYESRSSSTSLSTPVSRPRQLHPPRCPSCSHPPPCSCGDVEKGVLPPTSNGNTNSREYEWQARQPNWTNHIDSPPNSAIHSNEGSKGSSKSSGSNHSQLNGIMNGHLPQHIAPPPRC